VDARVPPELQPIDLDDDELLVLRTTNDSQLPQPEIHRYEQTDIDDGEDSDASDDGGDCIQHDGGGPQAKRMTNLVGRSTVISFPLHLPKRECSARAIRVLAWRARRAVSSAAAIPRLEKRARNLSHACENTVVRPRQVA
jgi:hypothetical protein